MQALRRVVGPFKEFGIRAGAIYAVDRVLRSISSRLGLYYYEMMVQPITGKPLLPQSLSKNLVFTVIDRGHPDVALMPARPEIKELRFDQGAVCLGVYRKDKLIGFMWFCFRQYMEDEVRCTYRLADVEHSVFDFDVYVMPEHRMGVGFVAVWQAADAYLHERGVRYTFSRLTRFNLASRRSHARLGGKRVTRAFFLQLGSVEVMLAGVFPYIAVTMGSGRAHLTLAPTVLESSPS